LHSDRKTHTLVHEDSTNAVSRESALNTAATARNNYK
jgi:hypothetical protein